MKVKAFKPSYMMYLPEIKYHTQKVLDSGFILQGKYNELCEKEIERLTGKKAVLFNSATSALDFLAEHYWEDRVITPEVNFVSVKNVCERGMIPVYTIRRKAPLHGALDLESYDRDELSHDVVHVTLAGQAGDDYIKSVDPRDFEDSSQCFMTMTPQGMVGTFGKAGVYSFTFNKFASAGEGGAIVSDDLELIALAKMFKDFGRTEQSQEYNEKVGFNYRMSELNAAMLFPQLYFAEKTLEHMQEIWVTFAKVLKYYGIEVYHSEYDNYSRLVIKVDNRDEIRVKLKEAGIETPSPIMTFLSTGETSEAEEGWDKVMCLPMHYDLQPEEMVYVAETLRDILKEA